jgi:hypothetical protein
MTIKSVLLAGALCLASVSLLGAKTHEITISEPAMAGTVQIPAGQYDLKVEGENAIFKNLDNNKTFTVPVKEETSSQKFDETEVMTHTEAGTARIFEIDLGGSHTRLEFK